MISNKLLIIFFSTVLIWGCTPESEAEYRYYKNIIIPYQLQDEIRAQDTVRPYVEALYRRGKLARVKVCISNTEVIDTVRYLFGKAFYIHRYEVKYPEFPPVAYLIKTVEHKTLVQYWLNSDATMEPLKLKYIDSLSNVDSFIRKLVYEKSTFKNMEVFLRYIVTSRHAMSFDEGMNTYFTSIREDSFLLFRTFVDTKDKKYPNNFTDKLAIPKLSSFYTLLSLQFINKYRRADPFFHRVYDEALP